MSDGERRTQIGWQSMSTPSKGRTAAVVLFVALAIVVLLGTILAIAWVSFGSHGFC